MFPKAIQKLISTYQIFGFIPLDKTLHVFIGAIITIILRHFKVRMRYTLAILALLELIKEIHDSYVLNNTLEEHMYDALATFVYPIIIVIIIKLKSWMAKKIAEEERLEK